jgi:heptosyltransferase-1
MRRTPERRDVVILAIRTNPRDFTWFAARSRAIDRSAARVAERAHAMTRATAAPDAVLVVRPSSLGDVVYALSIVSDIRRHRPGLAVDWVAERGFVPLVELCRDVRRVVPFALRRWRTAPLAPSTWRDIAAFRRALRATHYGVILDLQEQVKGALIARTARGVRHGFDRASIREPLATLGDDVHHRVPRELHFVERARRLAGAALGYAPAGPPRWSLRVPSTAASLPDRPYVVVLHATSRDDKLWPDDRWRSVLGAWDRAGFASVLPWGSASEHARSERLAQGIGGAIVPAWLSLHDVAALLARATLAIGVDTGFTHLAAALGTPTIAIFSVTDPARHGVACAGSHATDLGTRGAAPSVDAVLEAAGAHLRAMPRC